MSFLGERCAAKRTVIQKHTHRASADWCVKCICEPNLAYGTLLVMEFPEDHYVNQAGFGSVVGFTKGPAATL